MSLSDESNNDADAPCFYGVQVVPMHGSRCNWISDRVFVLTIVYPVYPPMALESVIPQPKLNQRQLH